MNTPRDPSISSYGAQQFQKRQFGHHPSEVKTTDVELARARKRVAGPANSLILLSAISLLIATASLVIGMSYVAINADNIRGQISNRAAYKLKSIELARQGKSVSNKDVDEQSRLELEAQTTITVWIGAIAVSGLSLMLVYTFSLVSFLKMKNLRARKQARVAAVLAVIPGTSPLLVVGIPFGVWALSVLSLRNVQSAFGKRAKDAK